jgi:DNA-binding transcriptional ArsR family regulator
MAPDSRRSTLQTEILAALATGPANSISALAKSLEKSRPSVSRSIKKLAEAGLTEKQGPTWQLTSMGQKEAELATRALHTSTKEVVEIAGKKFRAVTGIHERLVRDHLNIGEVMPSIANFTINPAFDLDSITLGGISSIVDGLTTTRMLGMDTSQLGLSAVTAFNDRAEEALSAVTGMSNLADTIDGMAGISPLAEEGLGAVTRMGDLVDTVPGLTESDIIASGVVGPLVRDLIASPNSIAALAGPWQSLDIAALAAPIVSAQSTYASLLETLAERDYALGLGAVATQSRLLSSTLGAVVDVADYYSTSAEIANGLAIDPELLNIPAQLSKITSSLADVFYENLESLGRADHLPIPALSDHLYHATLPVSHYADFSRRLAASNELVDPEDEATTEADERLGTEELDPLLRQLNPAFIDKRHGAWLTLNSNNPDRHSQAAGSMRELLSMVLHILAPDDRSPRDEKGRITRKARVRHIMAPSKSDADHVEAMANAIDTGYDELSRAFHAGQHSYLIMLSLMLSAESTMLMLLSNSKGKTG